jgi:transposase
MKDNRYYVGMDVHKAITVIAVLNAEGKQIMRTLVETKSSSILDAIRALTGEVHAAFEEGIHSAWLYDLLKPHVCEVVVCDPRDERVRQRGNKSDDADAAKLAEMLRLGGLKAVYHGERGMRKLKELARSYQNLTADSTRAKNRLKAIYRARAISYQGDDIYKADKRQSRLAQLEEEGVRLRAAHLYQELDCLVGLCEQAHKAMVEEARKHPAFKLLVSVPMLGPIRAALILAAVLTPHRFRTKRQFWAYIGLAVVTRSSADYALVNGAIKKSNKLPATRGLNQNFNHTLKMVFKTAATGVRSGPFKDYYEALLAKGTSSQMARLTLARKIAAIALAVWKKGEAFDPEKFVKLTA